MSDEQLPAAAAAWAAYRAAEQAGDADGIEAAKAAIYEAVRDARMRMNEPVVPGGPPHKYNWEAESLGLDYERPESVVGWAVSYAPDNTARGIELEWKAGRIILEASKDGWPVYGSEALARLCSSDGSDLPEFATDVQVAEYTRKWVKAARRYRQLGFIPAAIVREYVEKGRAEYTRAGLIQFARQKGIDVPTQSGKPRRNYEPRKPTRADKLATIADVLMSMDDGETSDEERLALDRIRLKVETLLERPALNIVKDSASA